MALATKYIELSPNRSQTPRKQDPPFKLFWHPIAITVYGSEGVDIAALRKHVSDAGLAKPINITQALVGEADPNASPELQAVVKAALEEKAKVEEAAKKAAKKAGKGKKGEPEEAPAEFFYPAPGSITRDIFYKLVQADEAVDLQLVREQRAAMLQHARDRQAAADKVLALSQQALDHALRELDESGDGSILPEDLDEHRSVENARANAAKARDGLARAEAEQAADARAARLYILDEPIPSVDRLADLRAGGLPLAAIIAVKPKPPADPAPDAPAPPAPAPPAPADGSVPLSEQIRSLFEQLRARHALGDVSDPVGPLFTLEIVAGASDGFFPYVPPRKAPVATEEGEEPPAPPPPEVLQLTKALETIRDQTVVFETWRAGLKVHAVPDSLPDSEVDLRLYRSLLEGVPDSAVSVAVVLHCMLEQVARTAADEGHEGNEADAIYLAGETVGSFFRGVSEGFGTGAGPLESGLGAVEVVAGGDESALAAAGLVQGHRQNTKARRREASPRNLPAPGPLSGFEREALVEIEVLESGEVKVELQTVSKDGWRSFVFPDGTLDALRVERYMQSLARLPGPEDCSDAPAASPEDDVDLSISRAFLSESCERQGTHAGLLYRTEALAALVDSIPEGVRAAHGEEIAQRRHFERLEQGVLSQVYSRAAATFPEASASFLPNDKAVLALLYGGTDRVEASGRVPCPISLREYLEDLLSKRSDASRLPSVAYELEPAFAAWGAETQYLYPDDGSVVRVDAAGPTVFSVSQAVLGLRGGASDEGPGATFTATLRGGIALAVTAEGPTTKEAPAPMRLQVSLPSSVVVTIESTGLVVLTRARTAKRPEGQTGFFSDAAGALEEQEEFRAVLPTAATVIKGDRGTYRLVLPDGDVIERRPEDPQDLWRLTNQAGDRWLETRAEDGSVASLDHLPPLEVARLMDPDTHANILVREDRVMVIDYPSGDRLVMDKDETRVYLHWEDKKQAKWVVESPDLPTITGDLKCSVLQCNIAPGLEARWASDSGALTLIYPEQDLALTAFDGLVGVHRVLDLSAAQSEASAFVSMAQSARTEQQDVQEEIDLWLEEKAERDAARAERAAEGGEGHEDEEEEEEDDIEPPPEGVDMAMVLAEECMESYVFDLQSFDACILTDEGSGFKISRGGVVKRLIKEEKEEEPAPPPPPPIPPLEAALSGRSLVSSVSHVATESVPAPTEAPPPEEDEEEDEGEDGEDGAESGAPTAPSAPPPQPVAARLEPRLFLVYPDGAGFEILAESTFRRLINRTRAEGTIVEQAYPVPLRADSALGGIPRSTEYHLLLKQQVRTSAGLLPLPVMSTARAIGADAPRAVPALQPPSKLDFPTGAITGTFFLPRAVSGILRPKGPSREPVVIFRHVVEQPRCTDDDEERIDAAHHEYRAFLAAQLQGPELYVVPDRRAKSDLRAQKEALERQLAERRAAVGSAYDDALHGEEKRAAAEAREAVERARRDEEERRAGLKKWAPWPPRTRPFEDTPQRPYTGKTLPYFKAEEGLRALAESPMLQSTRGNLMGRTLPPPLQGDDAMEAQRRVRPEADTADDDEPGEATFGNPAGRHGSMPGQELSLTDLDEDEQHPTFSGAASPSGPETGALSPEPGAGRAGSRVSGGSQGATFALEPHVDSEGSQAFQERSKASAATAGRPPKAGTQGRASAGSVSGPLPNLRTVKHSVTGGLRTEMPPRPPSLNTTSAPSAPHDRYLTVEGDVLRQSRTTSGQLMQARGRSTKAFILQPERLDLGRVYKGIKAHGVARLRNVSAEIARFHVVRPEPPLAAIYRHGPVAAGVDAAITIEFTGQELGSYSGEVTVKTETHVFTLPVTASVVPAPRQSSPPQVVHGGGSATSLADRPKSRELPPLGMGSVQGSGSKGSLS